MGQRLLGLGYNLGFRAQGFFFKIASFVTCSVFQLRALDIRSLISASKQLEQEIGVDSVWGYSGSLRNGSYSGSCVGGFSRGGHVP